MSKDVLREWAEDSAYQFKGLYKTADLSHYFYRISTIMLFVFAIFLLAWSPKGEAGRFLEAGSLLLSVVLLIFQKDIEKIEGYRGLADSYKNVYDELRASYSKENYDLEKLRDKILQLRSKNREFPISKIAYWWTKRVINVEMNLTWIKKDQG